MSPEIINEVEYFVESDYWAVGVLLYEVLHEKEIQYKRSNRPAG